jgi:hypothetical protein
MDHGVQRRERGGGQAAVPAATPELAAPSAAAVPREIPTCSASLLFRLRSASRRLPRAVPLPVFLDAFSARPVRGNAAAGPLALVSPRYPQYGAIITTPARLSLLTLLSLSSRGGPDCSRHPPRQRTVMPRIGRDLGLSSGEPGWTWTWTWPWSWRGSYMSVKKVLSMVTSSTVRVVVWTPRS